MRCRVSLHEARAGRDLASRYARLRVGAELMYPSRVQRLTVWIYKGSRRAETYLYVPEENNFERVPDALLDAMGRLELVMELEIHAERRLARVDARDVMKSVERVGYFLQMPPVEPEGKRRIQ